MLRFNKLLANMTGWEPSTERLDRTDRFIFSFTENRLTERAEVPKMTSCTLDRNSYGIGSSGAV